MSNKKHKRKSVTHNHQEKQQPRSLLSRHPKVFIAIGTLLVCVSILLLTVGYMTDAKVGVSMISLFFGVGFILFANAALPKKLKHS